MWILGIKPTFSGKAIITLKLGIIPIAALKFFFILMQKTADVVDFRNGSGNNKGEFI